MTTETTSADVLAIEVPSFPTNEPVALLIGIEDYAAFDASGSKNLLAGRNDVLAYWKVCRRLGFKAENIWVLTSPKMELSWIAEAELELDPKLYQKQSSKEIKKLIKKWQTSNRVHNAEATKQNIEHHANAFFHGLVNATKPAQSNLRSFLAYSGHGARVKGQLALCPSDINSDLDGAILLTDLGKDARQNNDVAKAIGRNLTVVLDCCFAANRLEQTNSFQRVPALGEKGAAKDENAAVPKIELGSRVFCAAGAGEQSYQAMLGGYWYSAFTWAFTVALEQWKIHESGDSSTISHNELLFRTRMLLKALSFRQHPLLVGNVGLSNDAVFGEYEKRGTKKTSVKPNAVRHEGQLDGGMRNYTVKAGDIIVANIFVTGSSVPNGAKAIENSQFTLNGTTYRLNTEYYYVKGALPANTSEIKMSWTDKAAPPTDAPTSTWSQTDSLVASSAPTTGDNTLFVSDDSTCAVNWKLDAKGKGTVTWYGTSTAKLFSTGTSVTLNKTNAPSAGLKFSKAQHWE